MKRVLLSVAMIVGATAAIAPIASAQSNGSSRSDGFSERYGILAEKNIFVKNRPPTRTGSRNTSERPRRTEEQHVLTGITIQEGRNVAFIENTGTHTTERVVQGASIAGGKITDVKLDSLEFETNGKKVRVAVGRNLLGDAYSGSSATSSSSSGSSGSTTTAPSGSGGGSTPPRADEANMSIEERMKRARERALGK